MKKSLLALAVLGAFAGAASAQSSVTIYGKIDLGIQKANKGAGSSTLAGAVAGTDDLQLVQGARSRLGFRGTEDLGGGLKGNFNIEHSFNPDDGQINTATMGGASGYWSQAWLGLSGGFGEVRLGREYSPAFYTAVAADPFGFDTVGQAGAAHTMAGVGVTRHNNLISYKTPSFAGLTALVAFAPNEGVATNGDDKNALGANLSYAAGPLALGFAWQNAGNQTTVATASETNLYILTAAYDLGFVRPVALYSKGTADNAAGAEVADFTNIQIGATAPLGGGELKALYAQRDNDTANTDIKKFAVGYHYPLSKRTKVYADLGTAKESNLDRRTAFDIGVQHNF